MKIVTISSPVYSKPDNSTIDCIVTLDDPKYPGEHQYTAAAHDPESHGQQLWAELQNGDYGQIAPYVAPEPSSPPPPDATAQLLDALTTAVLTGDKAQLTALNEQAAAEGQG